MKQIFKLLALLLTAMAIMMPLASCSSDNDEPKLQGTMEGHEYVDLGLPSGLKWATCNVGAKNPADYGTYYAWGETLAMPKFNPANCFAYGKTDTELLYAGMIDSNGNLTPKFDAATVNWGGTWRIPTKAEMEELISVCTWTWTKQSGKHGYKVVGPNKKSIFLPAAGYYENTDLNYLGSYGGYWNSSLACGMFFGPDIVDISGTIAFLGRSIRPVSE